MYVQPCSVETVVFDVNISISLLKKNDRSATVRKWDPTIVQNCETQEHNSANILVIHQSILTYG